jgi:dTDP-4-dehydrorhamnose reductase
VVKRLALIGANGMLARMVRERAPAQYQIHGFDLPDFDLTDRGQVLAELARLKPSVIVNCAAYTNVDACETHEELATRVNGAGPGYLAEAARANRAVFVHLSTDYVFDGRKGSPYLETDPVGPLSAYGRSKLAGERATLAIGLERYYIVRTSWLYGPGGRNFVDTIIRLAMEREELRIVADQLGTPTYTGDLAQAIFSLLALETRFRVSAPSPQPPVPGPYGIYHFSDEGQCSWYEFAAEIVAWMKAHGLPAKVNTVLPIGTGEYPLPARRPASSVFSKDKYRAATGAVVPDWRSSLHRYLQEREW